MGTFRKFFKSLIDFGKPPSIASILGSESDVPVHVLNKIELYDAITKLSEAGWVLTNRDPFSETGKMLNLASANFTRTGLFLHVEEDLNGRLELFEIEADKDEDISVLEFDLDELLKMIDDGELVDAKTIVAIINYYKNKLE